MPNLTATQSVEGGLSGLARLHTVTKRERSLRFNNLLHHITPALLERAYKSLNRQSAKGVDNESWESFGESLPERTRNLHQRIHTQQYKPQPVLRIWLPKPNGEKRPIGVTSVEDKVVQQALVWVLESIYEADFLGFSYGFRPQRNQHRALDAVYVAISQRKVSKHPHKDSHPKKKMTKVSQKKNPQETHKDSHPKKKMTKVSQKRHKWMLRRGSLAENSDD